MSLKACDIVPVTFERIRPRLQLDLFKSAMNTDIYRGSRFHTVVECFQLIAGSFRILHALQEWLNTSVFLPPEVIRDYACQLIPSAGSSLYLQDSDTVGPSATVPGIVGTARPYRTVIIASLRSKCRWTFV